jgi:hypothetical protein
LTVGTPVFNRIIANLPEKQRNRYESLLLKHGGVKHGAALTGVGSNLARSTQVYTHEYP